MKRCPKGCSITPDYEDKYCYKCGDELVSASKCGFCDKVLGKYHDYCPQCGKEVKND